MKLLTSKEVGVILGVSNIRVTQILKHDVYQPPINGRGRRYMYKQSSVDKFKIAREAEAKLKTTQRISRELRRDNRPSENYLTITEAAILSGLSKNTIATHLTAKYVRSSKFYHKDQVLALPKDAVPLKPAKPGKKRSAVCECGRTFDCKNAQTKCHVCRGQVNPDDPYDIMLIKKKGTRKCPGGCGTLLFVGQHTCGRVACTEKLRGNASGIDVSQYYGAYAM